MLLELHVENFALIDNLDLSFTAGLNVLTGETGAGKSIIVDALNAILGERAAADVVRSGSDKAFVQGAFDISGCEPVIRELETQGFEPDETLIISREITSQGRSQCRINGRLTPLGQLRDITQLLCDVHGQHEHQLLLSNKWQLEYLDRFAGAGCLETRAHLEKVWQSLQATLNQMQELTSDNRERERLSDLYRYQIGEIDRAAIVPGEEEQLRAESVRLTNIEKLIQAAETALNCLNGNDSGGAIDLLRQAEKAISAVLGADPEAAEYAGLLGDAAVAAQEAERRIISWQQSLDIIPERINEVQSRLDLINSLKRKYGTTEEEILKYRADVFEQLSRMESSDELLQSLEKEKAELLGQAETLAERLSALRQEAAIKLRKQIITQMTDLGMQGGDFDVGLKGVDLSGSGKDSVEFLLSANPGESARPLAKIASGGEASRIMLALKTALAQTDPVRTLVFDEIDAGIGGRTANVVGEKLKGISSDRQALCVTHLAQIARFANNHLLISKRESSGRTVVEIRSLGAEERVSELARMLGGDQESEAAIQHARELLGSGANEVR